MSVDEMKLFIKLHDAVEQYHKENSYTDIMNHTKKLEFTIYELKVLMKVFKVNESNL